MPIITAANICDEQIVVAGGGTIDRYSLNGIVDSAADKFYNIQSMLTSMGGRIMWLGGEIHIFAASERTATHLMDEDVIISAQYDPLPPAEMRYNEVRGNFISPEENFETQEFPPLIDVDEQALEGERASSLNLPYTQDHRAAQRLAKIALVSSRQPLLSIEALPAAAAFAPMDVVSITWANFGLEAEDFRIISQSINGGSGETPVTVSMTLVREETSAYSWAVGEEQVRGTKPALKVVDPALTPVPTGVSLASETLTSLDGSKQTSLRVSWNAPLSTVAATYVDYRVTGSATWLPAGSSTRGDTDLRMLLPPSQSYEVQVRHLYMNGNFSLNVQSNAESTETLEGADRLVHRGAFSLSTTYANGDVVTFEGSSYLYIGVTPSAGNPVTDAAFWTVLASVGGYSDIRFIRAQSAPATPTGDNPAGWEGGPPAANGDALWMTIGRKDASGALIGTWSPPQEVGGSGLEVQYSIDGATGWEPVFVNGHNFMRQRLAGGSWSYAIRIVGEDGAAGEAGGYFDIVFRRDSGTPNAPSGSPPSGWQDSPPAANGDPLWMSKGYHTAVGDLIGSWSDPQQIGGSGLEVQYSANGSSGWDNVFGTGDIFMRQRLAGGSWSSAIQIVGENGGPGPAGEDGVSTYTGVINRRPDNGNVDGNYIRFYGFKDGVPDSSVPAKFLKPDGSYFTLASTNSTHEAGCLITTSNSGGYDGYYIVLDISGGKRFLHGSNWNFAACRKDHQGNWTYQKWNVGWQPFPSSDLSEFLIVGTASRVGNPVYDWTSFTPGTMTLDAAPELGAVRYSDTANLQPGSVTSANYNPSDYETDQLTEDVWFEKGTVSVDLYDANADSVIVMVHAGIRVADGKANFDTVVFDGNTERSVGFFTEETHSVGTSDKYTQVSFATRFNGSLSPPFKFKIRANYLSSGTEAYIRHVGMTAITLKR